MTDLPGPEFGDEATTVVDEVLLAEIRAEAARRAQRPVAAGGVPDGAAAGAGLGARPRARPTLGVPPPGDDDEQVPVVEGYGALREIGRGGFSRVYEALQFDFERWVAVKVLNQALDDDEQIAEFERECRLMGVLSRHPNIVTVLASAFTAENLPCIVMELYPHGSYLDILQSGGPLGLEEILSVSISISGALATAHRQGVAHGDVKPQNIFRSEFGAALGDFGIASLVGHGLGPAKTRLSLYYAAPEVIERGSAAVSPFSDQYSLAATLYTLATGSRPFGSGDGDSTRDLLVQALSASAPRLPDQFPAALAEVLQKAMERVPSQRFRDMRAFAKAVAEIETAEGFNSTELRIAQRSGRFAGHSLDHQPLSPDAAVASRAASAEMVDATASGQAARGESREISAEHDGLTIVRPAEPVSGPPAEPPPSGPSRRRPPRWAMAVAAGLLVVVLGTMVAVLVSGGDQGDGTDTEEGGLNGAAPAGAEGPESSTGPERTQTPEGQQAEPIREPSEDGEPDGGPVSPPEASELPAPRGVTVAAVETGQLLVSWDAPEHTPSEILQYRVEWAGPGQSFAAAVVEADNRWNVVRPADLAYEISGLDEGVAYTVRVAARVADGLGEWGEASGSTLALPGAPDSVSATGIENGLTVSWEASSPASGPSAVTGYLLEWENTDGVNQELLAPGARSHTIDGLKNGDEYVVRVYARNAAGDSAAAVATGVPVSPRAVRIAFSSSRDGGANVYSVLPGGTGLELTTRSARIDTARSWSPDLAWVALDGQGPGEDWEIIAASVDGDEERPLTCNSVNDWGAAWSPDGGRVAFARGIGGQHDIYMLDIGSGTETQLTSGRGDDGLPSWSPDGTRIAFTRGPAGTREIWVVEVSTRAVTRLTVSDRDLNAPSWSPDGTRIAFASGYGSDRDIVLMNADGSAQRAVTSGGYHDDSPSWSPDGSQIAFARGLEPRRDVYVVDVASRLITPLVVDGFDNWAPAWSPGAGADVDIDPRACA